MKLRGRPISPGRATALMTVSERPVSFLGGVDPRSGTVTDPTSDIVGTSITSRVFAFPHGKGSTVGSYVLYGLARHGQGPAAIVNEIADAIVSSGAILGGIPMVDRIDLGSLATGDRVVVDGTAGTVDLPNVRERRVVSAFIRNRGRILVVRRGQDVTSFPDRWSAVSGSLGPREDPRDRARREVFEETGLRGVRVRASGRPFVARDATTAFTVHPFLMDAPRRTVRLNWENTDARWIRPEEIDSLQTVPRLKEGLLSVLPTSSGRRARAVSAPRARRARDA